MSYRVKIDAFEGPFDLLLHLVARQKVDIGAISIVEVADQYLTYLEHIEDFDLDVASDFILVAAQLLEMKAASLLPKEEVTFGDELDDMTPDEAREILIARLLAYKQFKSAASELGTRMENEGRMHPRQAGVESEFLTLFPDYLEGVTLHGLAVICADLDARRDLFLLEAEHIAPASISLDLHIESVYRRVTSSKRMSFNQLIGEDPDPAVVVVSFLAILDLYKRSIISLSQAETFGDIDIVFIAKEEDDGAR